MHAMTASLEKTDGEMVRAYRSGDRQAYDALVRKHFGVVYAVAYARLRNRETAEDLAQEVFVRAYLFLGKLDDPERYGPWVCRIARNLALDWLRRGQHASKVLPMVNLDDHADALRDTKTPEPGHALAQQEEQSLLLRAVDRLPAEQREMVLLHYMEQLSQGEIAERLGVHRTSVCRQLNQSLKSMRGWLEPALRAEVPKLAPRPEALARAGTYVAAVGGLSVAAQATLASAVGETVQASAAASIAKSGAAAGFPGLLQALGSASMTGVKVMGIGKTVTTVALVTAVVGGGAYYMSEGGDRAASSAASLPHQPPSMGPAVSRTDPLTIGFRAPVGTRLVNRMETDGTNLITMTPTPPGMKGPMQQIQKFGMDSQLVVLETPAGKGPVVEMTILGVGQDMQMGNERVAVDTRDPSKSAGRDAAMLAQTFAGMIGHPIKMHFNASGTVDKVEGQLPISLPPGVPSQVRQMATQFGNADYFKETTANFALPLPEKGATVRIGDSWKWTKTINMGGLGTMEIDTTYRFTGWENVGDRLLAVIEHEGTFRAPNMNLGMMGMKLSITDGRAKAKSYYDPKFGVITDGTFSQTIVMDAETAAMGKMPATKMRIEVKQTGTSRLQEKQEGDVAVASAR